MNACAFIFMHVYVYVHLPLHLDVYECASER